MHSRLRDVRQLQRMQSLTEEAKSGKLFAGALDVPPTNPTDITQAFTIRVKDCQSSYAILKDRGAKFITPPYDWGQEVRCFFRDPDGHLFEISEYKGNA